MNYKHLTIEGHSYMRKYYPYTAQKKYLLHRSYCHREMFHNQEILDYIDARLKETWSPEQIANTLCELPMPSFNTIYRRMYDKYLTAPLKSP